MCWIWILKYQKKYNELKDQLEGFFDYNKFGKKLSANDKKLLIKAFSKRGFVYFKNGFVLSLSDWAGVENISNKENKSFKNPDDFFTIFYIDTKNYKGMDIKYMVIIYIEEIAKNILKK